MKKLTFTFLLVAVPFGSWAEQPEQVRYQTMFVASMMDGICRLKDQPEATTAATSSALTAEEKEQCAYVRMGLRNGCFKHGACPSFDEWRNAGRSVK